MDDHAERAQIARFLAGDQSAYGELLKAHQQSVLRLALQILRNEETALDVAQEVFLLAFQELPRWRGEARLGTWLYRTTINICFEHNRAESKQRKIRGEIPAATAAASDDEAINNEVMTAINEAVKQLPARQRAVFILRQYENLRFIDIASLLEITEGGSKASYHKALMSLREKLKNFAPEVARESTGNGKDI